APEHPAEPASHPAARQGPPLRPVNPSARVNGSLPRPANFPRPNQAPPSAPPAASAPTPRPPLPGGSGLGNVSRHVPRAPPIRPRPPGPPVAPPPPAPEPPPKVIEKPQAPAASHEQLPGPPLTLGQRLGTMGVVLLAIIAFASAWL